MLKQTFKDRLDLLIRDVRRKLRAAKKGSEERRVLQVKFDELKNTRDSL